MPVETNGRVSVSDAVFEMLMGSIASGEWQPGTKIPSENKLCKQTNASRVSVRAAIQKLSSLGILESRQGGGTYVCHYNGVQQLTPMIPMMLLEKPDRISMFEFRKIIEVESAALAAVRADTKFVDAMYEATKKMVEAEDPNETTKYDVEFHYLIAKATNNPIIIRVFEILMDTYRNVLQENIQVMGSAGSTFHQQITAAIESRDPARARELMEEHLNTTIQRTAAINMRKAMSGSQEARMTDEEK